jgi:hypothetical protein
MKGDVFDDVIYNELSEMVKGAGDV